MKGFSTGFVIIVVAALLVLGGWWYWSQHNEVVALPSPESAGTGAAPSPAQGTASATTQTPPTGNPDVDGAMSSINAGADAYSSQAASEDGTESATSLSNSLNTQPDYVQ